VPRDDPPAVGPGNRQTLYSEVWADPVTIVAARYGVSDVALAKTCRRLHIPLPGRGYWDKKKAGRAPAPPPLPDLAAEDEAGGERLSPPRCQRCTPGAAERKEKASGVQEIRVAERLSRPHALVAAARNLLGGPGSPEAFVSCQDQPCLDLDVSRGALPRALRIMDALLKALEERGHLVDVTAPWVRDSYRSSPDLLPGVTRIQVGEEWIHVGVREGYTRIEVRRPLEWAAAWGGYALERVRKPTGRLSLFISNAPSGYRATWSDGEKQRVEDCLGSFVAYLPLVAAKRTEERLERERRHREWLEVERRRQEEEARRHEEERRRQALMDVLERWRLARDIRAFVGEVQSALPHAQNAGASDAATRELLTWALAYASEVDPVASYSVPPQRDSDGEE
jgi:hypothetical protein